jgi:hypothetical protein
MAYVLIPPLPSGARKSDYVPMKNLLRMCEHRDAAKNKPRVGDNGSSSALVAALQGAFDNNSLGAGSTKTPGTRRKRGKMKAATPVEVVEVVDDAGEGEDQGEVRNKGTTTLACALSNAFAHNSVDPNVTARPGAVAEGRTHQLRRSTRAGRLSDSSASVEAVPPPAKRSRLRPSLRTRVTSDADNNDTPSSSRRNKKRQPQTPTSPRKKKRRRLARKGDGEDEYKGEEEEEVEIVDGPLRELPRRASRTKPPSFSKAEADRGDPSQSNLTRTSKQGPSAPVSVPTSLPSPSPSPPPQSPTASPPDTNSLAGLPLTILPAPAATDIVIPQRALNHLHASPGPPDPNFETRRQESVQGFHREEAAVGAHGLLESPSAVAAIASAAVANLTSTTAITTTTTTTTMDSSLRANSTSPQNPSIDLGLDVMVPTDVTNGEQEQIQEQQDAVQAAVVPPHVLRISSSTHPDGPMLGFTLSEHDDARCTTSLSVDTEASSDGVGLELSAKTTSDMDFMLLDSTSPNSVFNANPGWVWHATAPSTGLVVGNEFVGDGTIDPSILGGAVFWSDATAASDDYIRSHRGSLAMRDRDKHISLVDDNDDLGDEGDVMGLLFDNSTDGDTVPSPPSSVRGAGGKGKDKDTATVAGANTVQFNTGIDVRADGRRKRRKSWRKALADDNSMDLSDDTESHDAVARPYLSNVSNISSSSLTATFCHHCRRKTFRPKMCCTHIRESTGKQCQKMYCDLCIQKRCVPTPRPRAVLF